MNHLWICGAGDLGWRVARQLRHHFSDVTLETLSPARHQAYRYFGFTPVLASDNYQPKAPPSYLLIALPPSSPAYLESVERALARWQKSPTSQGIFISSTGVYLANDGSVVTESSAVDTDSVLYQAEEMARKAGAQVLRLAGLYSRDSGPHLYWQRNPVSKSFSQGLINLIHRHDAADAIARLMMSNFSAKTWNLSDSQPLSRDQIASQWADLTQTQKCQFAGEDSGDLGKKVDASQLVTALDWYPRWTSFSDFLDSLVKPRNIQGRPLDICCSHPVTGFFRDGLCRTSIDDFGEHTICVEITKEFLDFSKACGNDLSTPRPEYGFAGLQSRDKWCVCASRWFEAYQHKKAPRMYLSSTHESFLEWVPMQVLKNYALDLS